VLAAVLLALGLAALGWLVMAYPHGPGTGEGRVVELQIGPDDGLPAVVAQLEARGLLVRPDAFLWYARVLGAGEHLRRGRVLVRDSMGPRELLRRIAEGYGRVQLRIVIPEGFNRFEIAERLDRWGVTPTRAFLAATQDPELLAELGIDGDSAEGWLFPDTYLFFDDTPAPAVVRRLVEQGRARFGALLEGRHAQAVTALRDELGWGEQEILTLASIVEKEAAVASERPIIAGVFLNRMRDPDFRPRRLQADPTVSYGCRALPDLPSCEGFDGQHITRRMLADADNPYNTYRFEGLPPGPIASPGVGALRAVLEPAEHDYLYFVARGGGRHSFSATLEAHNAAVERHRGP
jgi:UPF0755 protein